jgi:Pyruvate/2-oxoacid:ferredoxin oxidoreductase delta subunit
MQVKGFIIKKKCAAQPDICQPLQKCPEKAIAYFEDEDEPLGGRMEIDMEKCTGCGECVPLCCGNCIEMR